MTGQLLLNLPKARFPESINLFPTSYANNIFELIELNIFGKLSSAKDVNAESILNFQTFSLLNESYNRYGEDFGKYKIVKTIEMDISDFNSLCNNFILGWSDYKKGYIWTNTKRKKASQAKQAEQIITVSERATTKEIDKRNAEMRKLEYEAVGEEKRKDELFKYFLMKVIEIKCKYEEVEDIYEEKERIDRNERLKVTKEELENKLNAFDEFQFKGIRIYLNMGFMFSEGVPKFVGMWKRE